MPYITIEQLEQYFKNNHITWPDVPYFEIHVQQAKSRFLSAINHNSNLLMMPGLTLSDLCFVFSPHDIGRCYEYASKKSRHVFFLAAAECDLKQFQILLTELHDLQIRLPDLEADNTKDHSAEIARIKSLKPDLTMRDYQGRPLIHYAAGNCAVLKYILESNDVIESLTEVDQQNLLNEVVKKHSVESIGYVMGTFGVSPDLRYASFNDLTKSRITRIPVLKRTDIEAAFKKDDEALYHFLCQHPASRQGKPFGALLGYYFLGGQPAQCAMMIKRLEAIEKSPLMQKPGVDRFILTTLRNEFSGYTWDDSRINAIDNFPHFIKKGQSTIVEEFLDALTHGRIEKCVTLINEFSATPGLGDNDELQVGIKRILKQAIHTGNKEIVAFCLQGNLISSANSNDQTPNFFHQAMISIQLEMMKYFSKDDSCSNAQCSQVFQSNLLQEAILKKQIPIVRYFIEDLKFSASDYSQQFGTVPLIQALCVADSETAAYLLNRLDFLTDRFRKIVTPYCNSKEVNSVMRTFTFSKEATLALFAKSDTELLDHLHLMSSFKAFSMTTGINLQQLEVEQRRNLLQRLFNLEREKHSPEFDLSFLIDLQNTLVQSLMGDPLINEYQIQLQHYYDIQLEVISNPFKDEAAQAHAIQILENCAAKNRMSANNVLQKAYKLEVAKLKQQVESNQGNRAAHLSRLNQLLAKQVPSAIEWHQQYNDKLAVDYGLLALRASRRSERLTQLEKLRALATTHPFAQLQYANYLIRSYQDSPLKFLDYRIGYEARDILQDPRITHFAQFHHLQGLCLQEGIGVAVSVEKALHHFFLAAKAGCDEAAEVLKAWHKTKSNIPANSDSHCRAAIYCATLTALTKPKGYYSAFEDIANNFKPIFSKCMVSVADAMDAQELKLRLLQAAFELVKTSGEKKFISEKINTYLMQQNQNGDRNDVQFIKTIESLNAQFCSDYALRFINNTTLSTEIRSTWIVVAEMKWVVEFGEQACYQLNQLRSYLAKIDVELAQRIRMAFQVEVSKVSTTQPVIYDASLQNRYEKVRKFIETIPAELTDPISFELMCDPGACNDGKFYNRSTFEKIKGKLSPINNNITIDTFIPIHDLRAKAIELIEHAERSQINSASTSSSSSSSTSYLETSQAFFQIPSAPPADPEPLYPSVQDDDEVAVFGQPLVCPTDEPKEKPSLMLETAQPM